MLLLNLKVLIESIDLVRIPRIRDYHNHRLFILVLLHLWESSLTPPIYQSMTPVPSPPAIFPTFKEFIVGFLLS